MGCWLKSPAYPLKGSQLPRIRQQIGVGRSRSHLPMTNKQFSGFCHSCMSQKEKQELLIASFAHSRAQGVWIALGCYTPLSTMLFQKRQHIPVPSLHWSHSPQCLAIFGCSQHGRNLQQMTTGSHILLGSSPQLLH